MRKRRPAFKIGKWKLIGYQSASSFARRSVTKNSQLYEKILLDE